MLALLTMIVSEFQIPTAHQPQNFTFYTYFSKEKTKKPSKT